MPGMGGSSKNQTQTVKTEPYAGAVPYLLGGTTTTPGTTTSTGGMTTSTSQQPTALGLPFGFSNSIMSNPFGSTTGGTTNTPGTTTTTPGVLPEAARLYQQGMQGSPELSNVYNDMFNFYNQRRSDPYVNSMMDTVGRIGAGALDPVLQDVAPVTYNDISVGNIDPTSFRAAQGVLDPTNALSGLLSGEVNTQYLDPLAQATVDQITRNTMETVMPGIRGEAVAAGQYGGSRQGIAEGLATSRLQQDLAPALTGMYQSAFENAQNRQYGTATDLNRQAQEVATQNVANQLTADQFNAANQLGASQFNANLGLQQNEQEMQRQSQRLGNQLSALGAYQQIQGIQEDPYLKMLDLAQLPQQYQQGLLSDYANIILPASGLGGTNTTTTPMTRNTGAGALGGALGGLSAASMFSAPGTALSLTNPLTASLALGGGLLGGFF